MSLAAKSEEPPPKRRKQTYKLCGHCNKELSNKIFKQHKMLYYDPATKKWTEELDNDNLSSSELESLDEFLIDENEPRPDSDATGCDSEWGWDDPLTLESTSSTHDITHGTETAEISGKI